MLHVEQELLLKFRNTVLIAIVHHHRYCWLLTNHLVNIWAMRNSCIYIHYLCVESYSWWYPEKLSCLNAYNLNCSTICTKRTNIVYLRSKKNDWNLPIILLFIILFAETVFNSCQLAQFLAIFLKLFLMKFCLVENSWKYNFFRHQIPMHYIITEFPLRIHKSTATIATNFITFTLRPFLLRFIISVKLVYFLFWCSHSIYFQFISDPRETINGFVCVALGMKIPKITMEMWSIKPQNIPNRCLSSFFLSSRFLVIFALFCLLCFANSFGVPNNVMDWSFNKKRENSNQHLTSYLFVHSYHYNAIAKPMTFVSGPKQRLIDSIHFVWCHFVTCHWIRWFCFIFALKKMGDTNESVFCSGVSCYSYLMTRNEKTSF